jgi:hypothetical protein
VELTQCDINKDIQVGEGLQYAGIKVQVKHFDHVFRIYIKSIGNQTACRVEESLAAKKPAIQALSDILNNNKDAQTKQLPFSSSTYSHDDNTRKIAEIYDIVKNLMVLYKPN